MTIGSYQVQYTPLTQLPYASAVPFNAVFAAVDPTPLPGYPNGITKKYSISQLQDIFVAQSSSKVSVSAASTADLNGLYFNGSGGIGASLTNAGVLAALVLDTYAVQVGDRLLIANQTDATQNGIYTATVVGDTDTPWVLTRATDYDGHVFNINFGDFVGVVNGSVNSLSFWFQTATGPFVVGTTAITFVKQV